MIAYRYTAPESSFVIYPNNGWWGLMINGERYNDYASADDAAYDVSAQNTGCTAWDALENAEAPEGLSGWETIDYKPGDR